MRYHAEEVVKKNLSLGSIDWAYKQESWRRQNAALSMDCIRPRSYTHLTAGRVRCVAATLAPPYLYLCLLLLPFRFIIIIVVPGRNTIHTPTIEGSTSLGVLGPVLDIKELTLRDVFSGVDRE